MIGVSQIPGRLLRNPAKYFQTGFWRMLLREGTFRARAWFLYILPSLLLALVRRPRRVFVYPAPMNRFQFAETYVAWKVFAASVLRQSGDPRKAHVAIAWYPATSYTLDETPFAALPSRVRVLNRKCTDITKSHVGEVFARVFGYRLEVDPCSYDGLMLRKSERNGAHDACLLQGPLRKTEPGYVYQRLITYASPRGVVEWRVFIVGARPVAVYALYAPAGDRFAYSRERAEMAEVDGVFSAPEQQQIAAFCSEMGLDFGVLDVLRDGVGGKIYICDCNNTPTGPSPTLSTVQQVQIVHRLARCFEAEYLKP